MAGKKLEQVMVCAMSGLGMNDFSWITVSKFFLLLHNIAQNNGRMYFYIFIFKYLFSMFVIICCVCLFQLNNYSLILPFITQFVRIYRPFRACIVPGKHYCLIPFPTKFRFYHATTISVAVRFCFTSTNSSLKILLLLTDPVQLGLVYKQSIT